MKKQESKFFVTSDTFFGRVNKAAERGFATVEEMDEALVENWNAKVGKDDVVVHLGNFAWTPNHVEEILERLNGTIIFLLGDRDQALAKVAEVNEDIKLQQEQILTHDNVILSHWPLEIWPGKDKDFYHFHGHAEPGLRTDIKLMKRVNACCDHWSLAPIEIKDTIDLLSDFM
jgi:calcineurin-like phosphoesterase family protein